MKRTNPKKGRNEDPKFVPISWDEALGTIADKIMELRNNNETHKYMLMRGRYSYMRDVLYDRMTKIIGSPNNISHSAICAEAEKFGPYYTEGYWGYRQYDVESARYIILWGADPLAANRQVSYYSAAWGDAVDSRTRLPLSNPDFRPPRPKPMNGCRSNPVRTVPWQWPLLMFCSPRGSGTKTLSAILPTAKIVLWPDKMSMRKCLKKNTPTALSRGGIWS